MSEYFVHESSYVDDDVKVGKGTKDLAFLSYTDRGCNW